jgi:osmotically inducible lipoprotein OsmB
MQIWKKLFVVSTLVTSLSLSACSSMSQHDRRVAGTGVGVAAGALVGDAIIGSPVGIAAGAVAGGLVGHSVSK